MSTTGNTDAGKEVAERIKRLTAQTPNLSEWKYDDDEQTELTCPDLETYDIEELAKLANDLREDLIYERTSVRILRELLNEAKKIIAFLVKDREAFAEEVARLVDQKVGVRLAKRIMKKNTEEFADQVVAKINRSHGL